MAACGVVFDRQAFLWHLRLCDDCRKPGGVYWFLNVLAEKGREGGGVKGSQFLSPAPNAVPNAERGSATD